MQTKRERILDRVCEGVVNAQSYEPEDAYLVTDKLKIVIQSEKYTYEEIMGHFEKGLKLCFDN